MPAKKLEPIVIKFAHLAPELKATIGYPLDGHGFQNFNRIIGMDSSIDLLVRTLQRQSIAEASAYRKNYPLLHNPPSIRGSRLSRATSEAFVPIDVVTKSPFWGAVKVFNRIEAARTIQFLHAEIAKEMNHSGMIVNPKFSSRYSTDEQNAKLLGKTHPIFYVNMMGNLIFLPVSRMEYARYAFQQKRIGKMGMQPWRWRGYLAPPKAPQPWKEWANKKVKEWSEQFQPRPAPAPAMVLRSATRRIATQRHQRRQQRKR